MAHRASSEDGSAGRPVKRQIGFKTESDDDDKASNQQPNTPDSSGLFMTSPPGNEFRLCDEQVDAVGAILSGANVFLTGCAGSGKTAILKAAIDKLRAEGKRVRIAAPTGKAACNINGTTLHCLFGLSITPQRIRELEDMASGRKELCQQLEDMDVLVSDEISMVENTFFERRNRMAKAARDHDEAAFGGVQIIVCGDFRQLPPIKPFASCFNCGKATKQKYDRRRRTTTMACGICGWTESIKDQWAFCSQSWDDANFLNINLTQNHRQNEQGLVTILRKLSIGGTLSTADRNLILNHPCDVNGAVHIHPLKRDVDAMNKEKNETLHVQPMEYKCVDNFRWNQVDAHLRGFRTKSENGYTLVKLWDHQYEPTLILKEGMPVILTINLDVGKGLVNGSQGTICCFKTYTRASLPRSGGGLDHAQLTAGRSSGEEAGSINRMRGNEYAAYRYEQAILFVTTANPGIRLPVVRFHNGIVKTIFPDCSCAQIGDETPASLLSRTQVPLAA